MKFDVQAISLASTQEKFAMKFNQFRQLAQVALFSFTALGAGTAFAGEIGDPDRPIDRDRGTQLAISGKDDSEGTQKSLVNPNYCRGRFQTGSTWATPGIIIRAYDLADVSGINKEAKCKNNNSVYSLPLTGSQTVANEACAKGAKDNDFVRSFSKAGNIASGGQDHLIGILDRGAAVYNCPQGGSLNGSNCVQTVAPTCPTGFSFSGGQCRKTYSANLVTPAFCKFLP